MLNRWILVLSCFLAFSSSAFAGVNDFIMPYHCDSSYSSDFIYLTSDELEQIKEQYLMDDGEDKIEFWVEYELAKSIEDQAKLGDLLYENGVKHRNTRILLGAMGYFMAEKKYAQALKAVQKAIAFNQDAQSKKFLDYYLQLFQLMNHQKSDKYSKKMIQHVVQEDVEYQDLFNTGVLWLREPPSERLYRVYAHMIKNVKKKQEKSYFDFSDLRLMQACMASKLNLSSEVYLISKQVSEQYPDSVEALVMMMDSMNHDQVNETLDWVEEHLYQLYAPDLLMYYIDLMQSNGHVQKALEVLDKVWGNYEHNYLFWVIKARLYVLVNREDLSQALLEDFLRQKEDIHSVFALDWYNRYYDQVVSDLIDIYEHQQNYIAALHLLQQYEKEDSFSAAFACGRRAEIYAKLGFMDKAQELLNRLEEMGVVDVTKWRVDVARYFKDPKEGLPVLQNALKAYPDESYFRLALFNLYKKIGDYPQAKQVLNEAIDEGLTDVNLYVELVGFNLSQKTDLKRSEWLLKKAFSMDSESIPVLSLLIQLYRLEHKNDEVLMYGKRLFGLEPRERANLWYAQSLLDLHKREKAIDVLSTYKMYHPNDEQLSDILKKYRIELPVESQESTQEE